MGSWGFWPPENIIRVTVCFDPLKMSHIFIQNCCWITLRVSHHQGLDTRVRMEGKIVKTNFSRRLKQFDDLTWLTKTSLFYATGPRHRVNVPPNPNYSVKKPSKNGKLGNVAGWGPPTYYIKFMWNGARAGVKLCPKRAIPRAGGPNVGLIVFTGRGVFRGGPRGPPPPPQSLITQEIFALFK